MRKTLYFARFSLAVSMLTLWPNLLFAQSVDYETAMDDIMSNYLPDYPEPTTKALDRLFSGANVDELPANTRFLYYYYYGGCLADDNPDDAILYLTQARKVAYSCPEVGIRNAYALDAERALADLYLAKGTDEYSAFALILYNDVITVGISLLNDPDIGSLVVQAFIEEAKMGVKIWMDPEWVKKIWIQVRDLALELNNGKSHSYYVLNVLNYYCDLGDYDTALSFMEDAKNKDILEVDVTSICRHILDTKRLINQNESIKISKGERALEYWSSKLDIAALSTVLCSEKKSFQLLQEVEQGLLENNLTESYEYAKVLYLLASSTSIQPEIAEQYYSKQLQILDTTPQYFVYASDCETYNSLAVCLMKQGKYTTAQQNYKKALSCMERDKAYSEQPGYKSLLAVICHNVGRNLYFQGLYKESIDFFNKSIRLQEEASGAVMPKTRIYLSESQNYINKS